MTTTKLDLEAIRKRATGVFPVTDGTALMLADDVLALLDALEHMTIDRDGQTAAWREETLLRAENMDERDRLAAQLVESKLIASTLHNKCCDLESAEAKLRAVAEAARYFIKQKRSWRGVDGISDALAVLDKNPGGAK